MCLDLEDLEINLMNRLEDNNKYYINMFNILIALMLTEYIVSALLALVNLYVIVPLVAIMLFILIGKEPVEDKFMLNVFFILAVYIWLISGKEFIFIPQAKALLDLNENILYWFKEGHMHAIRLLIAYPGYIISRFCSIELNVGFGYYCILIFALFFRDLIILQRNIKAKTDIRIVYLMSGIFVMLLIFVMNGRIIFSFFGISIIIINNLKIWSGMNLNHGLLWSYVAGIVFSMVSSGTMLVSIAIAILGVILSRHFKEVLKSKILYLYLILASPVIYFFSKYIVLMIKKNIDYFGGGISGVINMLSHGVGKILLVDNIILASIIVIGGICVLIINLAFIVQLYKNKSAIFPVAVSCNISLYGSLFGISTGITFLVSAAAIITRYAAGFIVWDINSSNGRKKC